MKYFKFMRQYQKNLPYTLLVNNIIDNYNVLNEASHYYKGSKNAIDDISEHIFNDFESRKKLKDFDSGYSFISNYGVAVPRKEATTIDLCSNFKAFPIYVKYEYVEIPNLFFRVNDRAEYPDCVVISANEYAIESMLNMMKHRINLAKQNKTFSEAFDDDYDFYLIVPKLRHEFVHIRQNYGLNVDITRNKKMVNTDIEHIFKFRNNTFAYDNIEKYMYIFGFSELSQRVSEVAETINSMSDESIFKRTVNVQNYSDWCAKLFNYTQTVHFVKQMKSMIEDIRDTIGVGWYDVVLPIAYFFMFYNMFKTKISISKEHIQKVITTLEEYKNKNMSEDYNIPKEVLEKFITNNDMEFCRQFVKWMENLVYDFQANVYTAIYYVLYTRFWEFDDIMKYNLSRKHDILKKMIEYRKETADE